MPYIAVNAKSIAQADLLRKEFMQAAIDMAAGRSTQDAFDEAWHTFMLCFDPYQPAGDNARWLKLRLRPFYAVAVEYHDDGDIEVTYRHKSLSKRKRVEVPSLAGRQPAEFRLDDVSRRSGLIDITKVRYLSGITTGPFHLSVRWEATP